MRILIVTPTLPHPHASIAQPLVVYGQIAALLSHHHQITVATFAGPDPAERDAVEFLRTKGLKVEAVWRTTFSGIRRFKKRCSGWKLHAELRSMPKRVLTQPADA